MRFVRVWTACGPKGRLFAKGQWAILKTVQAAARRAGIEPICVHDLRRTFATRVATGGMPMPQLAEVLGHHSTQVTSKYYVHVRTAQVAESLAKVSQHLALGGDTEVATVEVAGSEVTEIRAAS